MDDVAQKGSENSADSEHLLNDLSAAFGFNFDAKNREPNSSSGALFILHIEDLSAVGQELTDRRAWVIRYAISPTAAKLGGRFELYMGKRGKGETELVVQVPAGVRDGTKLRVPGVCPGGSDLLIGIEVREHLQRQSLLGAVIDICDDCAQRSEQAYRAEKARRARLKAMLPQLGTLIGLGLLVLLCLTIWACSR